MTDVFPPRNLPGPATGWGRSIEGRADLLQITSQRISQRAENAQRSTAGQLATLSNNAKELAYRSAETKRLENIAVTGSATSEPYPRTNKTVMFDAVPGNRYAQLSISGSMSSTGTLMERGYLYVFLRGDLIAAGWGQPYRPASTPNEWQNNDPVSLFGFCTLNSDEAPVFTVRLVRSADQWSPGTSTVTLQNIVMTLTRDAEIK